LICDYREGEAVISLPESSFDPHVSVIALEFQGTPEVVQSPKHPYLTEDLFVLVPGDSGTT